MKNVSILPHKQGLKLVGFTHSTNGNRKRKFLEAEFIQDQQKHDEGSLTPNPRKKIIFLPTIIIFQGR